MLAPDASKLADDCWRVQVTNARLEGCTATEVTATSPKRPDASCKHRLESSTESATAVRRGHIRKRRTRRVNLALCDGRTHVHQERGASAPRGSRNRTGKGVRLLRCTTYTHRSGGRQPSVVHGTAPARECDFCDARTHVHQERGASVPRGSRNRTGKGVRLLPWTNAHAPGAGGVSPPWLAVTHVQGLRANVGAIADRAPAISDAVAVLHPRQHPRRADTRRSWLGESPPACAWRFPLHARSPNHGGLTPAALASECERLPAKLRLLRWTNAHAQERGASAPRGSR